MKLKLMGKKRGMTQRFDETGRLVVCTIIHAEPNVIVQIKDQETDGYKALQLGFEKLQVKDARTLKKRMSNPLLGHFRRANLEPRRYLAESLVESVEGYTVGQEMSVALFSNVEYVDVMGISKGRGFQGVMKRHGFKGGPASHGSGFHRHGGSTGMRSTPGRCLPGQKKAGRMGGDRVTVQNLRLIGVDVENHLLVVEGAIPGPCGALVSLMASPKKQKKKKPANKQAK